MRPTWKAETIVEPLANVSGSTSVWWLVVVDALHVACVNGSELICSTAASAAGAPASAALSATPSARKCRRGSDRTDGRISGFLSVTNRAAGDTTQEIPCVQGMSDT